ncbi:MULTISPECIES: serine hydrolase domain-containing protein [Stenotrophomonas]|uniref:serine hydrolase domain-containing protein n=1 Tax=Stenotrophomonas TaxID=40323 RepID=UPI00289B7860|nr:serine hydrolase domain-containing protein [Stenotrophomonas sp.]
MKRLPCLLLLLTMVLFAQGANAAPSAVGVNAATLDDFLEQVEKRNAGVGSVSVFRRGQQVYNRSFGQKHLPPTVYDADTRYPIASVTKMVTAILAFKLIEEERLSLDDHLSDVFPDMPSAQQITVGHLLAHSSGLGNFAIRDGEVWVVDEVSQAQILDEIRRQGTAFEPGTRVAYSNSAYLLLRMILEQRYGADYQHIVQQQIAEPLGLQRFAAAPSHTANTFKSYAYAGQWNEIKDIAYTNVIGVGDIASTTHDLNVLINALFHYRLLRRETVEQMMPVAGAGWGKGLAEFPFGEQRFLGHGGDVLGAHSRVIYNPVDDVSIAYSTNGERIPTSDFLQTLVGIVYGHGFTLPDLK